MSGKHEPSSNMTERCRICLVDHGCMTSLQNERLENKLKDLTKCTCIDVKYEENLPGVVCHVCLYKLNMWSEFKEQFVQSNKIFLEQLEISEVSDNTIKDSSRNESCTTKNAERKRKNSDDNVLDVSDIEKKKSRLHESSKVTNATCDTNQIMSDVICISDDDDLDTSKDAKNEHTDDKAYSGPMRVRLLPARRGRNIERRKASTKRWVERKKALIAATGENVSDTDSIASDDVQLSPVQKARAKTNAMDKDVERQKKISRVLKNLETNLTEKYTGLRDRDTDSDTRRTRSISKESIASPLSNKNSLLTKVGKRNIAKKAGFCLDSSIEMEKSSALDGARKSDDQSFTPRSLKSELIVGDITYAVTSTLILVDPSNLNESFNNLTKESSKNLDESNRENTDIIDAVQLRRINPVTPTVNSKPNGKFVERCLNIEVEGSELEVLKRVQSELANFVEKEMKQKLFGTSDGVAKTDKTDSIKTNSVTYLHQKLDQKLKDIVEIAIKKNIDASVGKKNDACNQTSTSFSAKSAMNLPRYQPKVLLKRLDIAKESKHYNINNTHVLTSPKRKLAGPFSMITRHKRQSIPPVRYGDYNTTTLDSDSDYMPDEDDDEFDEKPKVKISTRQSTISGNKLLGKKQDGRKTNSEEINKIENVITENHICGVCGLTFPSRKDVEVHVRTHKIASSASVMQIVLQSEDTIAPPKTQQNKQKMMRCKRCHEIVEARLVKAHVCKTSFHKCYVCNSMFRTKNLLAKHLESHDSSEFSLMNAIGNKKLNNTDAKVVKVLSTSQKNQVQKTETTTRIQSGVSEKNDIQSDKITSTGVKLDSTENMLKKSKETYTCFVCDKIFTDEEILKDHLQKHCDDLSEGEQSNNKEQYQCAICSKTLESDQALEEHVGKHLFDDEDDNPNLISIDQGSENNDKSTIETYQCGQCSETFDSEVLLEVHMQAHEEEVAIAEWEKQGMKVYQYQCMLCEELFNTEEELTQHLDIHNAICPHICQLCDKPFHTLEDLQEHVATH